MKKFVQIGNRKYAVASLNQVDVEVLKGLVADKDYTQEGQETVEAEINKLQTAMTVYPLPSFSIYRTFRQYKHGANAGQFYEVLFSFRALASYKDLLPQKFQFTVPVNKDLYRNLMDKVIEYAGIYELQSVADTNAIALTAKVAQVIKDKKIRLSQTIEFKSGSGVLSISNKHIVLGIDSETLAGLYNSVLFAEGEDLQAENAESIIISYLTSLKTYDAYFTPSQFTNMLNIPKESLGSAVRQNLSRRLTAEANTNLVGEFYASGRVLLPLVEGAEPEELRFIAILERQSMTPAQLEDWKQDETKSKLLEAGHVIVTENANPAKKLVEKGETLIATSLVFNPAPFNRLRRNSDTATMYNTLKELTLADVLRLDSEEYYRKRQREAN